MQPRQGQNVLRRLLLDLYVDADEMPGIPLQQRCAVRIQTERGDDMDGYGTNLYRETLSKGKCGGSVWNPNANAALSREGGEEVTVHCCVLGHRHSGGETLERDLEYWFEGCYQHCPRHRHLLLIGPMEVHHVYPVLSSTYISNIFFLCNINIYRNTYH